MEGSSDARCLHTLSRCATDFLRYIVDDKAWDVTFVFGVESTDAAIFADMSGIVVVWYLLHARNTASPLATEVFVLGRSGRWNADVRCGTDSEVG